MPGPRLRAVVDALARHDGFVSAPHLHAEMRLSGTPIGISTIYKILHRLAVEGGVDSVTDPSAGALFRLRRTRGRTHWLRCRRCGRAVALQVPGVAAQVARAAQEVPFRDVDYVLDVIGECVRCDDPVPLPIAEE